MDRTVLVGETYQHFKGNRYIVIAIAEHTETEDEMVVYQNTDGSGKTYVRPLHSFVSEVDKAKYPEATQTFRFEKIKEEENLLMDFLDAKYYKDKITIFKQMKEKMDERLINNIAVALDVVLEDESMEEQYEALLQYMNTRARFETRRLR